MNRIALLASVLTAALVGPASANSQVRSRTSVRINARSSGVVAYRQPVVAVNSRSVVVQRQVAVVQHQALAARSSKSLLLGLNTFNSNYYPRLQAANVSYSYCPPAVQLPYYPPAAQLPAYAPSYCPPAAAQLPAYAPPLGSACPPAVLESRQPVYAAPLPVYAPVVPYAAVVQQNVVVVQQRALYARQSYCYGNGLAALPVAAPYYASGRSVVSSRSVIVGRQGFAGRGGLSVRSQSRTSVRFR